MLYYSSDDDVEWSEAKRSPGCTSSSRGVPLSWSLQIDACENRVPEIGGHSIGLFLLELV